MNSLPARIINIQSNDYISLAQLNVCAHDFFILLIEDKQSREFWLERAQIEIYFKETDLVLSGSSQTELSISNRFMATVQEIQYGKILSKISLDFCAHKIFSLLPTITLQKLNLCTRQQVECFVKASDISLRIEE